MVGSEEYDLLHFHFHTPSEHKVNAKGTPMEVRFVHLKVAHCQTGQPLALRRLAVLHSDSVGFSGNAVLRVARRPVDCI